MLLRVPPERLRRLQAPRLVGGFITNRSADEPSSFGAQQFS